jgi:hypothetical protein
MGMENKTVDVPVEKDSVLRECGVDFEKTLKHRFPLEYCDDCGVPLYQLFSLRQITQPVFPACRLWRLGYAQTPTLFVNVTTSNALSWLCI